MNTRRFSVALFGTLLAGASLFAQVPQHGASTGWGRVQKEEIHARRQQPNINKSIANTQVQGKVTKKEPPQLHYELKAANRRMIRQKHDAKNVK